MDSGFIASPRDMVAARVKGPEDEENWILAEVVQYNAAAGKYDVDDIDAEEGKEYVFVSFVLLVVLHLNFLYICIYALQLEWTVTQACVSS